jgi:hypothetical protein
MPRLSRWFIRASLVYLALGFTFGGLMLFNKGILLSVWLWQLLPAHIEFLLLGWTVQLAMGVAFWILPRFSSLRGNERAAWIAFVLLNAGIWIAGIGQLIGSPAWMILVGRAAEVGAAVAFVIHAWPRVKPLSA